MDTPTKAFASVAFAGGLLVAYGGADALNSYNEDVVLTQEAASAPAVHHTVKASMIAHAQGIESGLILNGIAVPESLSEKISAMATVNLLQYIEAAMDMRHAGLEEAMGGNWDVAKLNAYVDRIAEFEPAVDALRMSAKVEASHLDMHDDRVDAMVALHVASALLEKDDSATRDLINSEDELANIMGRMRQGIKEMLGDIETISQINRVVMTEMAMEAYLDDREKRSKDSDNEVAMSL